MSRTDPLFLPVTVFVTVLKMGLCCGPFILWSILANLAVAVYLFFWGLPQVWWALLRSPRFSLTTRLLGLVASFVPLVLWFPCVILASTLLGLLGTLMLPWAITTDEDYHILGGFIHMMKELSEPTMDFLNKGRDMCERFGDDSGTTLGPGELPLDIGLSDVFGFLLVTSVGTAIVTPWWLLLMLVKALPFTVRLYYEMWSSFIEWVRDTSHWAGCVCFLPFLVANGLAPAGVALGFAAVFLHGLACGLATGVVALRTASFGTGLQYVFCVIREFDGQSHSIIFTNDAYRNSDRSCFDCCSCCACCEPDSDTGLFAGEPMYYARKLVRYK